MIYEATGNLKPIAPNLTCSQNVNESKSRKAGEQKSLAALKDQHWTSYRAPVNCEDPGTELNMLECENAEDNTRQAFDRNREADIARCWKPAPIGK